MWRLRSREKWGVSHPRLCVSLVSESQGEGVLGCWDARVWGTRVLGCWPSARLEEAVAFYFILEAQGTGPVPAGEDCSLTSPPDSGLLWSLCLPSSPQYPLSILSPLPALTWKSLDIRLQLCGHRVDHDRADLGPTKEMPVSFTSGKGPPQMSPDIIFYLWL